MADVDELARRTTTLIAGLARKGVSLATGVVVVVLVVCGLSYLTGLAALEGSARSAWTVVGLAMLIVAVGAPLLARWRLSSVTKRTSELVGEIRSLITRDADAQRVVIETVAHDEGQPRRCPGPAARRVRLAPVQPAAPRHGDGRRRRPAAAGRCGRW